MEKIYAARSAFHFRHSAHLNRWTRSMALIPEYPAPLQFPYVVTVRGKRRTLADRDQDVPCAECLSLLDRVDFGKLQNKPALVYPSAVHLQRLWPVILSFDINRAVGLHA